MNSQLYDDHPTRPCSHLGPLYRRCPVCQKAIPAHNIIALHIFKHIPHYTCTPCLDFLLSRGFKLCPFARTPIYIFVSMHPSSLLVPSPKPPHPACKSHDVLLLAALEETLDNYKLKNNHLYSLFNTTVINSLVLYFF